MFRPLNLPEGDVLVHAGDICMYGNLEEVGEFAKWMHRVRDNYKKIIVIAGNHDFAMQDHPEEARRLLESEGITYLNNQEVEYGGLKFYGSPYTPTFYAWAFMKDRGEEIRQEWNKIPLDTNVLITHGPPFGVLDKNAMWGDMCGCEELKDVVFNHLPELKLHVFGHIHEGYGQWMDLSKTGAVHFVNASVNNEAYSPINQPIVVEL